MSKIGVIISTLVLCALMSSPTRAQLDTTAPPGPRTDQLEKRGAFACDGEQHIRLENVLIEGDGVGIELSGKCRLTLVDSQIETTGWGVRMQGNAVLTVRHSKIRGDKGSFSLVGNAKINASGSIFEGTSNTTGSAAFNDDGNNRRGASSAKAGISGKLEPTKPASCMGRERKLVLEDKSIDTNNHGLLVQGNCKVTIRNCRIKAKDRAIVLQGSPTIDIQNSEIISEGRAIVIVGDAKLTIRNTRVVGRVQKVGQPEISDEGGNVYE